MSKRMDTRRSVHVSLRIAVVRLTTGLRVSCIVWALLGDGVEGSALLVGVTVGEKEGSLLGPTVGK